MANSYSHVVLVGNVVRDTEIRDAGKSKVADNALAITDNLGGKEVTTFVDITLWGRDAETMQKFCPKGRPILVEGRLRQDKWTDNDGNKRSKTFVNVDRLVLIGTKPTASESPEAVSAATGSDDLPF